MNSRTRTISQTISNDSNIIYCICINDLRLLKNLVTESNVNQIIDAKNKYTALHYAIRFNNESMIDYLLSIGANPSLKTIDSQTAFDLSLKYQTKTVYEHEIKDLKLNVSELKGTVSALERKIENNTIDTKYLVKSIDDLVAKNNNLKCDFSEIKKENLSLKNRNSLLIKENSSLLDTKSRLENIRDDNKKEMIYLQTENKSLNKSVDTLNSEIKTLKRKYESLDESYNGLLTKIQKK
jgi:ankyrin repeat protein